MSPAAVVGGTLLALWTIAAALIGYIAGWFRQQHRGLDQAAADAADLAAHVNDKPPAPGQQPYPPRGAAQAPGTPAGEEASQPAPPPLPGPVPNESEREALANIERGRPAMKEQAVRNAQRVADGLRLRFPTVDDTTIGLIVLEVGRWTTAAIVAAPEPATALRVISHALGLCAEEMTRLARQEETSDGRP